MYKMFLAIELLVKSFMQFLSWMSGARQRRGVSCLHGHASLCHSATATLRSQNP
jgi:hypothetical protein